MAMTNPKGRANYEPNGWAAQAARGRTPRADSAPSRHPPTRAPRCEPAPNLRRSLQPGPAVLISQTPMERITSPMRSSFELSKCERVDIRSRAVSHLPATLMRRLPLAWPTGPAA